MGKYSRPGHKFPSWRSPCPTFSVTFKLQPAAVWSLLTRASPAYSLPFHLLVFWSPLPCCHSSWEAELLTPNRVEWDRSGRSCVAHITLLGGSVCVCVCRGCGEFIVACECEFIHLSLSLSLLFLRAAYCLIRWVRDEPCRRLRKVSKGFFGAGFQLVHSCHVTDCVWVMACNWKWDREEWGTGICVYTHFFLFFRSRYCVHPLTGYTFTDAATSEAKHREGEV